MWLDSTRCHQSLISKVKFQTKVLFFQIGLCIWQKIYLVIAFVFSIMKQFYPFIIVWTKLTHFWNLFHHNIVTRPHTCWSLMMDRCRVRFSCNTWGHGCMVFVHNWADGQRQPFTWLENIAWNGLAFSCLPSFWVEKQTFSWVNHIFILEGKPLF